MESNNFKERSDFISYKKVLLFGAASTGKTSFAKILEKGNFQENITHTDEGKVISI